MLLLLIFFFIIVVWNYACFIADMFYFFQLLLVFIGRYENLVGII